MSLISEELEFEKRYQEYRKDFHERALSGRDPLAQYNETEGFSYYMGLKDWDIALHAPDLCPCLFQRHAADIKAAYGDIKRIQHIKDSAAYVASFLR